MRRWRVKGVLIRTAIESPQLLESKNPNDSFGISNDNSFHFTAETQNEDKQFSGRQIYSK